MTDYLKAEYPVLVPLIKCMKSQNLGNSALDPVRGDFTGSPGPWSLS